MMALYIDVTNRHAFMLPYRKAVGRIKIDAPNGQPAWLASARDTKLSKVFYAATATRRWFICRGHARTLPNSKGAKRSSQAPRQRPGTSRDVTP